MHSFDDGLNRVGWSEAENTVFWKAFGWVDDVDGQESLIVDTQLTRPPISPLHILNLSQTHLIRKVITLHSRGTAVVVEDTSQLLLHLLLTVKRLVIHGPLRVSHVEVVEAG